jgi:hypothetical protein
MGFMVTGFQTEQKLFFLFQNQIDFKGSCTLAMFIHDNAHNIATRYHLPYLPWWYDISIFCRTAQGGQGKYNGDCHMTVHFLAKLQYYASIEVYGETKVSPRQAKSCIQGNDMKDGRSVFLFPFFPLLLQFFYFVFFEFFGCQEDVGAFYRELGELAEVSKPFHLCSPCSLEFSRWVTRQTFWS